MAYIDRADCEAGELLSLLDLDDDWVAGSSGDRAYSLWAEDYELLVHTGRSSARHARPQAKAPTPPPA